MRYYIQWEFGKYEVEKMGFEDYDTLEQATARCDELVQLHGHKVLTLKLIHGELLRDI